MKLVTRFGLGLVFSLALVSAGCEDDPNDLDFLKKHADAGSDAGMTDAAVATDAGKPDAGPADTGVAEADTGTPGSDAGGDDAGDAN